MTLQQLNNKLQNLCYQGYSQRTVKNFDDVNNCFKDVNNIEYQLVNGDEIVIDFISDNSKCLGE